MSTAANCFDVEQPLINLEGNFLFQRIQKLCLPAAPGCVEVTHCIAALHIPKIDKLVQLSQLLRSLLGTLPSETSPGYPGMIAILGWFSLLPDEKSNQRGPSIINSVGFISFLSWLEKHGTIMKVLKEFKTAKKQSGTDYLEVAAKNQLKFTTTEAEELRRDLEKRVHDRKILCGTFGITRNGKPCSTHTITLM